MMALIAEWGGDLIVSSSGDLAVVPKAVELEWRIIRRLLTNPGDYVWHPEYGTGLASHIGDTASRHAIEANILYQMSFEKDVPASPAPTVMFGENVSAPLPAIPIRIQFATADRIPGNGKLIEVNVPK